jgi:O-antigen ligase
MKINIKILGLPILLVPLLLISGPFLSDLVVSLSSIIFIFYIFKTKNYNFINKKPLIYFFIFSLYLFFNSLFVAENLSLSLQSSFFYFRIGLFACIIWYLIENNKDILNHFYYILIICFSFLVIDGYFQFIFGYNIIGFPKSTVRVSSFFNDELILGSYLSRLFPLLFALFILRKKNIFEKVYIGALFILVDILIYLSGERTSFFFLNLSTLFIILLINEYKWFRLFTFILAIFVITIITFLDSNIKNRMILNPAKSMGFTKDALAKNIFTSKHDSHIRTAFNMFLDKPIFGHGPKMFRVNCSNPKYSTGIKPCSTHPHNFYIQLLAETGLIGFSYLLIIFIYVMYCSIRHLKSIIYKDKKRFLTSYQVCVLASILITVWPLSPNGNFFNNWLMIIYSFPFGFYLHSVYGKNKNIVCS